MIKIFLLTLLASTLSSYAVVDNSFLLEEAYQQPKGVYQFIQKYRTFEKGGEYDYNFDIEAPITDLIHQFSLSAARTRDDEAYSGSIADLTMNYRWGAYNKDNILLAERFGLIAPTGNVNEGSGRGVWGFEFMQAFTVVLNEKLAHHWNLGVSVYPRSKFKDTDKRTTLTEVRAGTSFVYFHKDNVNYMFEVFLQTVESLVDDKKQTTLELTFSPGVRFGKQYEWKEMEVVPGIGLPVQFSDDSTDPGILLYLSFEPKLH